MIFDPKIHHRRSIRLKGYDYSLAGAYFVTIDTYQHEQLLGEITLGEMKLNASGLIVHHTWVDLPNHYPNIELDTFCIMPNHIHGIIVLGGDDHSMGGMGIVVGAGLRPAPTNPAAPTKAVSTTNDIETKHYPLSEIVRAFKSFSARRINLLRCVKGIPVWQRNYYEHIIRNEREYEAIRDYIIDNPVNWEKSPE